MLRNTNYSFIYSKFHTPSLHGREFYYYYTIITQYYFHIYNIDTLIMNENNNDMIIDAIPMRMHKKYHHDGAIRMRKP